MDLTADVCYTQGETDEVLIHLRSKFRVPDSPHFCYDYTLLDTGNKTNRTLMSEELFRRFNPKGEIRAAKITINTAAQGSKLEVIGVPQDPHRICSEMLTLGGSFLYDLRGVRVISSWSVISC